MLGAYGEFSRTYLTVFMVATTLFFSVPIFVAPLAWARLMRWTIPEHTHLAIYFGRCLGAFCLIVELLTLRAVLTGTGVGMMFDLLFLLFGAMLALHIHGAIARIQPITETLEIGFWGAMLAANALFYPV